MSSSQQQSTIAQEILVKANSLRKITTQSGNLVSEQFGLYDNGEIILLNPIFLTHRLYIH